MKRLFYSIFLVILVSSCYRELPYAAIDMAIESAGDINREYLDVIDSLRLNYILAETDSEKWEYAYSLYGKYRHYNSDSSLVYAKHLSRNQGTDPDRIVCSKSAEVWNLARQSKEKEADSLFTRIQVSSANSPRALNDYFHSGEILYSEIFAMDPDKARICITRLSRLCTKLDSASMRCRLLNAKMLRYNGKPQASLDALKAISQEEPQNYDYSLYHYNMALAYDDLGQADSSRVHLIKSALMDLQLGKRDYSSLYTLGLSLFRDGDSRRACTYLSKTIEDALAYNYPVGLRRSASANLVVNEILHRSELRQSRMLFLVIVVVSILSLLSLFLALYLRASLYKMRRINKKLKQAQASMEALSFIKDSFLAGYMEQAAKYIRKVDDTKSQIRRTLKSDGIEGVSALLRSPSYADEEYPNYYKYFDDTFLGIFPGFVQAVNKYMLPAAQFCPGKGGANVLNTELRILALIRLGIVDSDRIATILHTSRGTVFTYRSKMKRNAACPPEEFEERISEIR